ncbi:MAG: glycosyltransferase family 4 protein [Chitinispirillaceae bacterium]|nr:glycosyltransferase family 4 protein [Chitinispirillaceae bacterium]
MKTPLTRHVIVYEYLPPSDGGIAQMAWGIARELVRRGLPVGLAGFADLLKNPMYRGFGADLWPLPRRGWKHCKDAYCCLLGLRLYARYGRSVVLYSLTWKSGRAFSWLSKAFGWRYVLFAIGNEVTRQLGKKKEERMRRVFHRADTVVALSTYVAGRLRPLGLPSFVTINPGVDAEAFTVMDKDACKKRFGWEGKHVVLTAARVVARKGQDTVIRALPLVAAKVPRLRYVVAGTGEEAEIERLKVLARSLGVQGHVAFTGFFNDADKTALYNAADVYVMVSRYEKSEQDVEGFGITFLEAGACGVPVIGGRSGGIVDAIDDGVNGYLVTPDDHVAVADRLTLLLENPGEMRSMGVRARHRVLERFTWGKYIDRLLVSCGKAVPPPEYGTDKQN